MLFCDYYDLFHTDNAIYDSEVIILLSDALPRIFNCLCVWISSKINAELVIINFSKIHL